MEYSANVLADCHYLYSFFIFGPFIYSGCLGILYSLLEMALWTSFCSTPYCVCTRSNPVPTRRAGTCVFLLADEDALHVVIAPWALIELEKCSHYWASIFRSSGRVSLFNDGCWRYVRHTNRCSTWRVYAEECKCFHKALPIIFLVQAFLWLTLSLLEPFASPGFPAGVGILVALLFS